MKNACIAVRCKTALPDGEISRVLAALIEGGYCADKVFVLASGEMHEFAQTVIECKNFFDNVFVCAHADELSALRGKVQELLGGTLTAGNKRFFCIPDGEEGERAVRGEVIPALRESDPSPLSRSFVRAVGVPSGLLSSALEEARARAEGITFSCHEKDGDVRIEMRYPADIAKSAADEGMRVLAGRLADYVYAIDDTPLNRRVYELLKLRGLKLSVAESFTGGGVAKKIIEIPGASEVLFESVVAYDNGSKRRSPNRAPSPTKPPTKWRRGCSPRAAVRQCSPRRASRGPRPTIRTSPSGCAISRRAAKRRYMCTSICSAAAADRSRRARSIRRCSCFINR